MNPSLGLSRASRGDRVPPPSTLQRPALDSPKPPHPPPGGSTLLPKRETSAHSLQSKGYALDFESTRTAESFQNLSLRNTGATGVPAKNRSNFLLEAQVPKVSIGAYPLDFKFLILDGVG